MKLNSTKHTVSFGRVAVGFMCMLMAKLVAVAASYLPLDLDLIEFKFDIKCSMLPI